MTYGSAVNTYILYTSIETRTLDHTTIYPRLKPTRAFHIPTIQLTWFLYIPHQPPISIHMFPTLPTLPHINFQFGVCCQVGALCFQFGVPEEDFLKFLLAYFPGVRISSHAAAFTTLGKYLKPACCCN